MKHPKRLHVVVSHNGHPLEMDTAKRYAEITAKRYAEMKSTAHLGAKVVTYVPADTLKAAVEDERARIIAKARDELDLFDANTVAWVVGLVSGESGAT